MATSPHAEFVENQADGWPISTVPTITDCMSLPLLMHLWGSRLGAEPFIFLGSGDVEAHTTLCNGCRRHRHCECVCDLVPWHTQRSRSWVSVCELLAYGHFSPPFPLMTPYANRGMVWCSLWKVFTCLLTCGMSLPCPPGCVSSPAVFTLDRCFGLLSCTSHRSDPGGCESL